MTPPQSATLSEPRNADELRSEASHNVVAFPKLDANDLAALAPLAESCTFDDGQIVFQAGQADLDLFVVETGAIEIHNPADGSIDAEQRKQIRGNPRAFEFRGLAAAGDGESPVAVGSDVLE